MSCRSQLSGASAFAVSDTGLSNDTGAVASQAKLPARRVPTPISSVIGGDAPINALLQNGTLESRLALRKAKVQREVNDATAKLVQASTKGMPHLHTSKSPPVPKCPVVAVKCSMESAKQNPS